MQTYSDFASVYDVFMQDAPYGAWLSWLTSHFTNFRELDIADVGCGTGTLTVELARKSKRVVGVDLSEEMLARAAQRSMSERCTVEWLCQDMRQLVLPRPVDLVLSTCDCMNYLLSSADVSTFVRRVHNNLQSGGWFCFDVLGPKRLELLQQSGVWYDLQPDAAVLYETSVDAETAQIGYELCMFIKDDGGSYSRHEESHQQQYFSAETLTKILDESGFEVAEVSGDFGEATDLASADRICFSAHKRS